MEYVIIALTVLFGAGLTFFSGFGLGTIMLPVFSLFFPLPVAVTAQALVHFANNVFKFGLVYKHINYRVLLRFGIPALLAAFVGAFCLKYLGNVNPLHDYFIGKHHFEINYLKIVVGLLMIFFAWFELSPRMQQWEVESHHLSWGGVLSGFFGGFSGHQGAFRAAFLAKSGLDKKEFVGTSNAISLLVDMSRITMYLFIPATLAEKGGEGLIQTLTDNKLLLVVGVGFAFLGTYFGKKLVEKTTIQGIQKVVGILLIILGLLFIAGII